jgi:hypothetical protein
MNKKQQIRLTPNAPAVLMGANTLGCIRGAKALLKQRNTTYYKSYYKS